MDLQVENKVNKLINDLWFKRRDIISDDYDESLEYISKIIPLKIHKIPSGTKCWTWIVPEKWTCHEAYLETLDGKRILSYADNPLHVVSYSLPYDGIVSKEELFKHLYTHPKIQDAIPFKFKYYERDWGLCCSQKLKDSLTDTKYRVKIKTDFSFGKLKIGEVIIPGQSEESFVLCAHLCHPAMVNDDLTGIAVAVEVMRILREKKRLYYTYRLLIVPETIGSVAWLSHNEELIPKIKGGLFLEMLGTDIPHSLQLSFMGGTQIDKCFMNALRSFDPEGWIGKYCTVIRNDERQFNAPGVRIPMLSLSRVYKPEDERWPYPEYHSSFDNLSIVSQERLEESINLVLKMLEDLENNYYIINRFKGRIFCSRYDIHIDSCMDPEGNKKMFEIMDLIDGTRTIVDIAQESSLSFKYCWNVIDKLLRHNLVEYSRAPKEIK